MKIQADPLCLTRKKEEEASSHGTNEFFFNIRFWYLRCCGCPWNWGRQHLVTPLKTCHNIEAGFLTGWLLCLSSNSEVTASETLPFPHLGCVPGWKVKPWPLLHVLWLHWGCALGLTEMALRPAPKEQLGHHRNYKNNVRDLHWQ